MSIVWLSEKGEGWNAIWKREFNDGEGDCERVEFDLASVDMLKFLTKHTTPVDDDFLCAVRQVRERYF